MDGTPAGLCISTRQTIRRDSVNFEEFHVPEMRMAYAAGLRSGCSVPLISHDKVFGAINVGALREAAFTAEDAELLEQIAGPVAIAVENSLNYERANRERVRAQTLLEINNSITTTLDLRELIRTTSSSLRNYFKHDFAGMALYHEDSGKLMVHSLDSGKPDRYLIEGELFPIEGTLNGLAFTSRKPVIRNRITAGESSWPLARKFFSEQGLQSVCFIPLVSRDRTLGTLSLGCRVQDAFGDSDVELLTHIAGQVALAVENVLQYKQIESLKNKLASEC